MSQPGADSSIQVTHQTVDGAGAGRGAGAGSAAGGGEPKRPRGTRKNRKGKQGKGLAAGAGRSDVVCVPKHLLARVLYTNPVCLLSTRRPLGPTTPPAPGDGAVAGTAESCHATCGTSAKAHETNVMTVTWLTATSNRGHFVMSLNERRHTAAMLRDAPNFGTWHWCALAGCRHSRNANRHVCLRTVLSVPVQGMEDLVTSVGGCSGADCDKVEKLHIPLCAPGWSTDEGSLPPAVEPCVAHIVAHVEYAPPRPKLRARGLICFAGGGGWQVNGAHSWPRAAHVCCGRRLCSSRVLARGEAVFAPYFGSSCR